jgi:histidinol phosphatase-like enzyme
MTEQRMKEVNTYIVKKLEKHDIKIGGCFACPFVNKAYLERAKTKGNKINPKYYLEDSPCFKPNPGMINQGIKLLNLKKGEYIAFMIGDRYSDMKLAENAGATGILVESYKTIELKETDKTRQMGFYVAKDFLDAIKYIIKELEKLT